MEINSRMTLRLQEALTDDIDRARTRQLLADALGPVVLVKEEDGEMFAELEEPAERLLIAVAGEPLGLVAAARFHRYLPFRLL